MAIMKKTQLASLLLSLLLMLLFLSFHDPVSGARVHYVVHIPVHSSGSAPPSSSCGSGIYHVAGATERLCRHPKKPSAAKP
ncbi:unnamed protein product [Arabidopsis lyrata]|uniref:uncharacterized protein LOC110231088 n=1 Tax=Arabidopsis lyrata subsp. lyrata TaxID=81972 RepID=UPI000A29C19E|nr:uncharacterized protein LOC110231088 [Arabidopsis lyrata subsp. lyrata]CAH8257182.1 unnamed protein product [Arabidopsis lyrata]|eukprot:XP_020891558.1 uncharacterized protein LOC110231088 [Arabidopsis lyrata subsp. lyrata]